VEIGAGGLLTRVEALDGAMGASARIPAAASWRRYYRCGTSSSDGCGSFRRLETFKYSLAREVACCHFEVSREAAELGQILRRRLSITLAFREDVSSSAPNLKERPMSTNKGFAMERRCGTYLMSFVFQELDHG